MRTQSVELLKSNHKKNFLEIIVRSAWWAVWFLGASWTPRILNPWRVFILRSFGSKIGQKVLIFGSVSIDMPWNLEIGDFSAVGKRVWLYNYAPIQIGKNTVISQDSVLCTSSHDYTHPHMPLFSKPIAIGDQAWICAQSFICPGVTIGEGAVVGARSVVTKDIPAWMVCAGNPCKPLKVRTIQAH